MSKKYDAGVKEYRDTYWTPEYVPLDTDLLACFKCTGQEGVPREEVAAAVAAESSTGTWSTVWSELLTDPIEAADAMTKAAEVRLIGREFVGGGYVTVLVRGETGAVNAAVRAGADACERVGDGLVAAHIIARPHREVEPALGNGDFLGQKD